MPSAESGTGVSGYGSKVREVGGGVGLGYFVKEDAV